MDDFSRDAFLKDKKITDHGSFKTWEGAHPTIQPNVLGDLPHDRYILALERNLARIENGTLLDLDDCNALGAKHTHASWGLCTDDLEVFPDAQDHSFPLAFLERDRRTPLSGAHGDTCPFDRQEVLKDGKTVSGSAPGDTSGCFYRCMIFRPKKGQPVPSRAKAVELYQITLGRARGTP